MSRRTSLAALAGVLAALLCGPAAAQAGERSFKLRAGPYRSADFNVLFPKQLVPAPKLDGFLTDMDVRLVDRRGKPVTINETMLHHVVFKNFARFVGRRRECRAPNGEAFFGTGEEKQALDLPKGYGYPVSRSDRWRMNVMLMSHAAKARNVYVEYTGRIVTGRDAAAMKRVVPYWVSADGCSSSPSYPVAGGGEPGSVDRRTRLWRVPVTGRLVAGGGHLHGGSKDLQVSQPRCDNRRLFANTPTYGTPQDLVYTARPILHEPGPIGTRWFSSVQGISVRRGEQLRVTGLYDNQYPHTRVMAITHLYIHPTSNAEEGCAPLPADATENFRVDEGRPEPPHAPVPLNRLTDDLKPVEIDKPRGAFANLGRGGTVQLRDFAFRPANVRIRAGATIRYAFRDEARHNVTWADGPALASSKTLSRGSTDPTTFRVPGRYKLFCYLHPMQMTQVVEVTGARGGASASLAQQGGASAEEAEPADVGAAAGF